MELLKIWPSNADRAAFHAVMTAADPRADDDPVTRINEGYVYFCGTFAVSSHSLGITLGERLTATG